MRGDGWGARAYIIRPSSSPIFALQLALIHHHVGHKQRIPHRPQAAQAVREPPSHLCVAPLTDATISHRLKLDPTNPKLTDEQLDTLKHNIQLMRDAIVLFTATGAARGVSGHTGTASLSSQPAPRSA